MRSTLCSFAVLFLLGCQPKAAAPSPIESRGDSIDGIEANSDPIETVSLLGRPLTRPMLPADFRQRQEDLLAEALAAREQEPTVVEPWIWIGRRTAYLGHYGEAIDIYSAAIERFPDEARLYRHRGHRYLSLRRFDQAITDFERAAALFDGRPDIVEPDGLPNERGIPTSTLQSNVWYHLGLAHFLEGDFEQALGAYQHCLAVSKNPDMLVATSHWLYMSLRRLGRNADAAEALAPISAGMEIIENRDYHRLLMMARGEVDADSLLIEARTSGGLSSASIGFGVGHWFLVEGDEGRAREIFAEITAGDSWAAFGAIAAEAELARSGQSDPGS